MQDRVTINSLQLFILLVSMMFGIGVLTLPRNVTESVGTSDSWISVLLTGILTCIPITVIGKLSAVFPRQHFLDYTKQILGQSLAWVLGFAVSCYFVLLLVLEIRAIGMLVRTYLLPKTPLEVLIILPIFASVYLTTGGANAVIRLNEMLMPFLVTVFIVILALSCQNFHFKDVQPLFRTDIPSLIKGIPSSTFSLLLSN